MEILCLLPELFSPHLFLSQRLLWVGTGDEGAEMDVWGISMQGGLTEPELFSAVPEPSGIGFPVAIEVLASVFASQEHL